MPNLLAHILFLEPYFTTRQNKLGSARLDRSRALQGQGGTKSCMPDDRRTAESMGYNGKLSACLRAETLRVKRPRRYRGKGKTHRLRACATTKLTEELSA